MFNKSKVETRVYHSIKQGYRTTFFKPWFQKDPPEKYRVYSEDRKEEEAAEKRFGVANHREYRL